MATKDCDQAYEVKKRNRYSEDLYGRTKQHWTKNVLDLDKGSFLSRTPRGWARCFLFYLAFYTVLFGMFAIMLFVHEEYLPLDRPRYEISQPGLEFKPNVYHSQLYISLEYNKDDFEDIERLMDNFEDNLLRYGDPPENRYGGCDKLNLFGYPSGKPCIFFKINRVIGFKAQTYNTANELPKEAPAKLKTYISQLSEAEQRDRIWLTCKCNASAVRMTFMPGPYFEKKWVELDEQIIRNPNTKDVSKYFYDVNDWNRIIAVQLTNIPLNMNFKIRCYLWAKNIVIDDDGYNGRGMVRFVMKIEDSEKIPRH